MKQPWGTFIVGWAGSGLCRESLQMSHEDDHLPGGALHTTTTTTSHLPPNPTAGSGLATALQPSPTGGRQLNQSEQLVADRPGSPPIDQVHQQAAQRLDLPRDLQPPSIHR